MRLKKALSWALALALSFSLAAPALAADTGFSDVQPDTWYYSYVTQCVSRGLMSGMGDGTFSPDSQMTVGQFLRVAVSAAYPDNVKTSGSAPWWDPYYAVALENDLIMSSEYARTSEAMDVPITRQEMARIASRVTYANGEKVQTLANTATIADFSSIDVIYRSCVQDCFAKGILAGVDSKGTFDPTGVLTRGAASVVILHMVDPSTRVVSDLVAAPVTEKHEWYEGELRTNYPQVGDVIIKGDGTRVTLEIGPGGVLGACQGVDIYSGIVINGIILRIGWVASDIGQTPLKKDPITGEVHLKSDWTKICNSELNPVGSYRGSTDGEIYNTWWQWDASFGDWMWLGPN